MKGKISNKSVVATVIIFIALFVYSASANAAVRYPTITTSGANYMAVEYGLYHHGYNGHEFSGVITPNTRGAVRAFQRAKGLSADGIPGDKTLSKLFNKTIKYGDRSYLTVALQILLNKHGANLTLNGLFYTEVKEALMNYQRASGLGVDGLCGNNSWRSLFATPASNRAARNAASTLKITSYTSPGTLNKGSGFSVRGTVSSNYKISSITVRLLNPSGGTVCSKTVYPNATSYDLHRIDSYIKFGLCPVGTCRYQIWASDSRKSTYLVDKSFTVKGVTNTNSVKPVVFNQNNYPNISYGYANTPSANAKISDSGCAVVALVNAIYNLNGSLSGQSGVQKVASFSLAKNCRDPKAKKGTYRCTLNRLFCSTYGPSLGIAFVKCCKDWTELTNYLKQGCVAVVGVPNHIMCITAYSDERYLLLDSNPKAYRGTENGYRWATRAQLEALNMTVDFDIIKKTR